MIIPAVIPRSLEHLEQTLKKVSFAAVAQIDVVDGQFVKNTSWPYEPEGRVGDAAPLTLGRGIEVDLMVGDPVTAGRDWLQAGAKTLVFHIESLGDRAAAALGLRAEAFFELGLAVNNDTLLDVLYPHIDQVDFVQLMGIAEIGSQGQPFDPRVLERIAHLHALYPALTISIDGGVSPETLPELKKAGASRFVVGSAILSAPDPKVAYEELLKIDLG